MYLLLVRAYQWRFW